MARVQKIDNADLKRFARSNAKRKSREVKVFFLIKKLQNQGFRRR